MKLMIIPDVLKEARKARNLSQDDLALISKVSLRTVKALEAPLRQDETGHTAHKLTVSRLAKALKVEEAELSGEAIWRRKPVRTEGVRSRESVMVASDKRLSYDIIKRRYGLSFEEVVAAAPLFLELLVRESMIWRHERLSHYRDACDGLAAMPNVMFSDDRLQGGAIFEQIEAVLSDERHAIESWDAFKAPPGQRENSVFSDFVRDTWMRQNAQLAGFIPNFSEDDLAIEDETDETRLDAGIANYQPFTNILRQILGPAHGALNDENASRLAKAARALIWQGTARLDQLDDEKLLAAEHLDGRLDYLAAQVEDDGVEYFIMPGTYFLFDERIGDEAVAPRVDGET